MSEYKVTLNNSNKKTELKKKLDDGDISATTETYQSNFTSKSHDATVDNWISTYGITDDTKKQLRGLKTQSAGKSKKTYTGQILNGKKVIFFILEFTKEDNDGERTYNEASATVELTSTNDEHKKLIDNNYKDLAILALTSGSDSYTLSITEK
ncbi:unnamed protein product [Rhizophagus irregularis]|uniref:Uncharacterized protein n=1 Tax=Rhizophagus irregularis TaxID=588596 RepID=A0A2I1HAY3_9GLOM|nr:hypothetical protein RhiirA4_475944 [Rhizophagus irregularis]CAB4444444.1 unnamed protein product [Rhizophagus irregularis]